MEDVPSANTREQQAIDMRFRREWTTGQMGAGPGVAIGLDDGYLRLSRHDGACVVKGLWLVDWDCGDGYYCWRYPEASIAHFHGYDDGFNGRMPIN